ncbi:OXR1, partial [Symbiodinium pilosum]
MGADPTVPLHETLLFFLKVCPLLVTFKPDPNDQHVKEFGDELYTVTLEVQDILQCGGITMPHTEDADLSYFLQLQIRCSQ